MEGKKESTPGQERIGIATRVFDFIGEVKAEVGRITWTSAEELRVYVKVVVGATLVFGFGIYLVDLTIQGVLHGLSAIVRAVIG